MRKSAPAISQHDKMPRPWQVALPGEVCAVLVTTLVLEGWSSRLAPEHSVLEQARQPQPLALPSRH